MDELKLRLSTFFMREAVAKIVRDTIKKKTGQDIPIELNEFEASVVDGKTHITFDMDADASIADIFKIVKKLI